MIERQPKDTTARERKARERDAKRKQGLRQVDLWAYPEDHKSIKQFAEDLTHKRAEQK